MGLLLGGGVIFFGAHRSGLLRLLLQSFQAQTGKDFGHIAAMQNEYGE
jgi:hypothetical protein